MGSTMFWSMLKKQFHFQVQIMFFISSHDKFKQSRRSGFDVKKYVFKRALKEAINNEIKKNILRIQIRFWEIDVKKYVDAEKNSDRCWNPHPTWILRKKSKKLWILKKVAKWNPNGLYLLDSFGYWRIDKKVRTPCKCTKKFFYRVKCTKIFHDTEKRTTECCGSKMKPQRPGNTFPRFMQQSFYWRIRKAFVGG